LRAVQAAEDAPLIVVDAPAEGDAEVTAVLGTASAVVRTAPGHQVLVVGDGRASPRVDAALQQGCDLLEVAYLAPDEPLGRAARVNAGLEVALVTGRDAVLVAGGVEPQGGDWLARLAGCAGPGGGPVAVAGGRLESQRLVVSAGLEILRLQQTWVHRLRMVPVFCPAVSRPAACPVSAALQYVRHVALEAVGLYEEAFAAAWDDVDFCLRVLAAGLAVGYEPSVAATAPQDLVADQVPRYRADSPDERLLDARHPPFAVGTG
jgi:hypothetical protein